MQILKKSMWVALASEAADGTRSPSRSLPTQLKVTGKGKLKASWVFNTGVD